MFPHLFRALFEIAVGRHSLFDDLPHRHTRIERRVGVLENNLHRRTQLVEFFRRERIDVLPVESVTISGFDMPTVGAYPDTSVTVDSTCIDLGKHLSHVLSCERL